MKRFLLIILSIMFLFICENAGAQNENCINNLKVAQNNFDDGDFDEAITLLNSTLKDCDLDKQDKINAYEILILCYLTIDNLKAADDAVSAILNLNPIYSPNKLKNDNRLIKIFGQFSTKPTFSLGIEGGINFPTIHTQNSYSVVYNNGEAPNAYLSKIGSQFGINMEKRFSEHLWFRIASFYQTTNYQHFLYDVVNETINYSENLTYIDLPISIKYYALYKYIQPYAFAGADFSLLNTSQSTTTNNESTDIVNRIDMRNKFSFGILGGIGARYIYHNFIFSLDARYCYYPENINKQGTRYNDKINLFTYYYIDDNFRIDYLKLNAGVSVFLKYKNFKKP